MLTCTYTHANAHKRTHTHARLAAYVSAPTDDETSQLPPPLTPLTPLTPSPSAMSQHVDVGWGCHGDHRGTRVLEEGESSPSGVEGKVFVSMAIEIGTP